MYCVTISPKSNYSFLEEVDSENPRRWQSYKVQETESYKIHMDLKGSKVIGHLSGDGLSSDTTMSSGILVKQVASYFFCYVIPTLCLYGLSPKLTGSQS